MYSIVDHVKKFERTGLSLAMRRLEIGQSVLIDEDERAGVYNRAAYIGIKVKTMKTAEGQVAVTRIS